MPTTPEEFQLQVLRALEADPTASQRELAEALGVSVGKTNYALQALIQRGWVKVQNFTRSGNKRAYWYKLTPDGVAEKSRLAYRFLKRKRAEYDSLMAEIEQLRAEVEAGETAPESDREP